MTNALPKKFEICTKCNRTSRYILTFEEASGKYVLQNVTSLEDAYNAPVKYSVRFVQEALDEGSWEMTKKLDEPEMKFPFTIIHRDYVQSNPTLIWEMSKGKSEGWVNTTYEDGEHVEDTWSISEVKRFIKEGIWIVKHVGEKTVEFAIDADKFVMENATGNIIYSVDKNGNYIFNGQVFGNFNTGDEMCFKGFSAKAGELKLENPTIVIPSVVAPQAPESTTTTVKLAIECDTAGAVAAIDRMTQAYENLAISMESVIALQAELKGEKNV